MCDRERKGRGRGVCVWGGGGGGLRSFEEESFETSLVGKKVSVGDEPYERKKRKGKRKRAREIE